MLLTGTFLRAVDDKLRIAVPKRLRDAIPQVESVGLYVAPGNDGALALYPQGTFERLAERLAAASATGHDVRAFSRLFYAQAERVELDSQGRIRIPPPLAKLAELEGEVVLLGVNDHLELWSRPRWESYLGERAARYDEITERALCTLPTKPGGDKT